MNFTCARQSPQKKKKKQVELIFFILGALPFQAEQQNLAVSPAVNYIQPTQPSLPVVLPTGSVGVNMLTGSSLSQTVTTSPRSLFTSTALTTVTSSLETVPPPNFLSSRAPPVNVVITSSDPLPTNVVSTPQPILSVTIPPQHIRGSTTTLPKMQPHNYQISLPSSCITQTTPSILSQPAPTITTQSILSNIAPPIFSAVPNKSTTKLSFSGEQECDADVTLDKSNVSHTSLEEHDPCPDFKAIIPLPDEVPVNTGEEGETELFCEHAKLYRHVNTNGMKEWKERGVGVLKILHNPKTGKVRVLMRRDQVHKICANHFITPQINLTPMAINDKAYIWAAQDFADEVVVTETFCVKFKTPSQAKLFSEAFESAKKLSSSNNSGKVADNKTVTIKKEESEKKTPLDIVNTSVSTTAVLGGFVFSSTPTFQPKETVILTETPGKKDSPKSSPFSNFTFSKTNALATPTSTGGTFSPLIISHEKSLQNDEEVAEDFVSTAEFKPVVALPDLVEVKTGEEDLEMLFEKRCKLFRYDSNAKEWKERGLGNIRVLKGEDIRIIMRREQVHKVCCNHTVLKSMNFSMKDNAGKAVVWTAQDFSEGELKSEMFTARFKTEEQALEFLQVIQAQQTSMDENNKVISSNKHHKPELKAKNTSFGEKFRPAKGSWECKNCYIINDGKSTFCIACETPKIGTTPKKTKESGAVFSFGNFSNKSETATSNTGMLFGQNPITSSWGNAFKPAEGSWECKSCYTRNPAEKKSCVACLAPTEGAANVNEVPNLSIPSTQFTFGIPKTKKEDAKTATPVGFGDAFKPTAGSWECKVCLIRNKPTDMKCVSCENAKDGSTTTNVTSKGKCKRFDICHYFLFYASRMK